MADLKANLAQRFGGKQFDRLVEKALEVKEREMNWGLLRVALVADWRSKVTSAYFDFKHGKGIVVVSNTFKQSKGRRSEVEKILAKQAAESQTVEPLQPWPLIVKKDFVISICHFPWECKSCQKLTEPEEGKQRTMKKTKKKKNDGRARKEVVRSGEVPEQAARESPRESPLFQGRLCFLREDYPR